MPEIEQQHQELVNMLSKLNDAVKNRESRESIYRAIDSIIAETCLHFATEERVMLESEYPEIDAHKEKHMELIQDALHLKAKLDYVGEQMFTEWFNHWPFARVLAHIQYADKQVQAHVLQTEH